MKRREILKLAGLSTGALAGLRSPWLYAAPEDYSGRLLITVQAEGGWDVTNFCDPKSNVPGELEITKWSRTQDVQTAGNIAYAPLGQNSTFFNKYHNHMMVINGVDMQTNSHTVGVLHNWSGRNSEGYPSLSALFASANAPQLPLAYLNFGGFSATGRLIRFTRLSDTNNLQPLLQPNVVPWQPDNTWHSTASMEKIQAAQQARLARLAASRTMSREKYNLEAYESAIQSRSTLSDFVDVLPPSDQIQQHVEIGPQLGRSALFQQAQLAILGFKAGVACSADLHMGGFDTHTQNDENHTLLLNHLTSALDYLWDYAEQQGVADRLTVVVGSDFSRTPHYNSSQDGKDHWPIGSVLMMEKNASWGNRTIGSTDEGHNAYKINPNTLKEDSVSGTTIYPKHVHNALRQYLELNTAAGSIQYPFNNTELFDFFNPAKIT